MKNLIALLLLWGGLFFLPVVEAGRLHLTVKGIGQAGIIHVALYDSAEVFENDVGDRGGPADGIVKGVITPLDGRQKEASFVIDIPDGTYAIGVFYDLNDNNKLDKSFFGRPQEPYGFGNNAKGFMGPPSFAAAAVKIVGDIYHVITF